MSEGSVAGRVPAYSLAIDAMGVGLKATIIPDFMASCPLLHGKLQLLDNCQKLFVAVWT